MEFADKALAKVEEWFENRIDKMKMEREKNENTLANRVENEVKM